MKWKNCYIHIWEYIIGYTFGKDIEFVQRDTKNAEKVNELATIFQDEDSSLEDNITATYCSICGIGYQCTLSSDDYKNNPLTGLKIGHLSPLNTFSVQSYDFKNKTVLTCHYYDIPDKGRVYTIVKKMVYHL